MAKPSIIDSAIANIDAQIADLDRAKDIIRAASTPQTGEANQEPKPRKARKKRGMPATDAEAVKF